MNPKDAHLSMKGRAANAWAQRSCTRS
jgi:hypothetical protein